MGLREPVGTSPLCRVASHALFGPWLRGGSPPRAGQAQATRIRRHRKRKLPNARKIISAPGKAALRALRSPEILNHGSHGSTRMVLRANLLLIRVNPCHPWSKLPARHIHLADHAPVPTGSSHPLSPIKPAQAGNKSSALAESARCDGSRFIAMRADDQATRFHPRPISISRPNVKSGGTGQQMEGEGS
jgi:hypothetical protein